MFPGGMDMRIGGIYNLPERIAHLPNRAVILLGGTGHLPERTLHLPSRAGLLPGEDNQAAQMDHIAKIFNKMDVFSIAGLRWSSIRATNNAAEEVE